jgi:hypothetical protein
VEAAVQSGQRPAASSTKAHHQSPPILTRNSRKSWRLTALIKPNSQLKLQLNTPPAAGAAAQNLQQPLHRLHPAAKIFVGRQALNHVTIT